MIAHIHLRDQEFKVRSGMTIRSALLRLDIQPEAVLPTRGGELLTDDEILQEGDEIRLHLWRCILIPHRGSAEDDEMSEMRRESCDPQAPAQARLV